MAQLYFLPVGDDAATLYPLVTMDEIIYIDEAQELSIKQNVRRTELDDGLVKQEIMGAPTYVSTSVKILCRTSSAKIAFDDFLKNKIGYGVLPFFMRYNGVIVQARLVNGMNGVKVKSNSTSFVTLFEYTLSLEWIHA